MNRWIVTVIVLAHAVISFIHGNAHTALGVALQPWQTLYVLLVILLAPLVALVLVWTRFVRLGFVLLLISMAGALVFGGCYHFVIVSPDHVSHLPPGDAQGSFRLTALLLLATEALGVVAALLGLRSLSQDRTRR